MARGYEFYVRVACKNSIDILFLPREHKFIFSSFYHINVPMTAFLMIFRGFPTTYRRFPKIFQNCSEGQTNVPEHFPEFPKISEDYQRHSGKTRRCIDDTPTNLNII